LKARAVYLVGGFVALKPVVGDAFLRRRAKR
jgi:hypothetical protein